MNPRNRKHKVLRLLSAFALILSLFAATFAWNKPGHMVTGAIAARELKTLDPQALAAVVQLLKKHPFYEERWKAVVDERAGEDDEAVVLFAFAARWADDARGTSDHREKAHFINFPFKPENQPASVATIEPDPDNIEVSFEENLNTLRNSTDDIGRAKALCWLFHLTGDSHQPLHATALFTTVFPQGDRGGTLFFVRIPNGTPVKLHAQWDNMVVSSDNFQSVHNTFLNLLKTIKRGDLPNVGEDDQKQWIQESVTLAKEDVYLNGELEGGRSASQAVALPSGYVSNTKPVARKRMTLAGYRLADMLQRLF